MLQFHEGRSSKGCHNRFEQNPGMGGTMRRQFMPGARRDFSKSAGAMGAP